MNEVLTLDLSNVKLYGREQEFQTLQDTWKRVISNDSNETNSSRQSNGNNSNCVEAVMIFGHSGSGKSRLVTESLQDMEEGYLLFGSGKFDQLRACNPFSALAEAVDALLQAFLASNQYCPSRKEFAKSLQDAAVDLKYLFPLLPSLQELLPLSPGEEPGGVLLKTETRHAHHKNRRSSNEALLNSIHKLGSTLEDLLVVLCRIAPLVLFIDDVQFADVPSLDQLVQLMTSEKLTRLGLAIAYRDNEVTESHPWHIRLSRLNMDTESIHTSELPVTALVDMTSELTSRDKEDCQELAEMIHAKTLGNPFYTLQVLDLLQRKSILRYDLQSYRWTWEMDELHKEIQLTDNVVDLVVSKLGQLDDDLKHVAKVASCLGQEFDRDTMLLVVDSKSKNTSLKLREAVELNLIVQDGPNRYKWGHDRIQEAAYSTIDIPAALHWDIGVALKQKLDGEADDSEFMTIVHQLDFGVEKFEHQTDIQRLDLALWNITATNIALSKHAHAAALRYAKAGMAALGDGGWREHYNEMLELSTAATKLYVYLGRHMEGAIQRKAHYENVKSLEDRVDLYPSEVASLVQTDIPRSMDRAVEIVKEVSGGNGVPRKPSILYILRNYFRVKRRLKKLGRKQLLALPDCEDVKYQVVCEVISFVATSCWNASEINLLAAFAMLGVDINIDHGFVAAFPFAVLAIITSSFGNLDMTCEVAEIAIEFNPRCVAEDRPKSEALARLWGLFRQPMHSHVDPLLRCFKELADLGDNQWAAIAAMNYVHIVFLTANLPLGVLRRDAMAITKNYQQKNVDSLLDYLAPTMQLLCNLNDKEANVDTLKSLRGSFISAPSYYDDKPLAIQQTYQSQRLTLAVHLQDLETCREISWRYWKGAKHPDGTILTGFGRRFIHGMADYCLARQERKNKKLYFKRGGKMERELVKFAESGNVNVVHLVLILAAERVSLEIKDQAASQKVKEAFDKAISTSLRAGFIADAALACHRASIFFQQADHQDADLQSHYLNTSVDLYSRWEAWAVVRYLAQRYKIKKDVLDASMHLSASSHYSRRLDLEDFIANFEKSRNPLKMAST